MNCIKISSATINYFSNSLFQGVRSNAINACDHQDPCKNGGVCISTDNGPSCDCSDIDFTGVFCEKGMLAALVFQLSSICRVV